MEEFRTRFGGELSDTQIKEFYSLIKKASEINGLAEKMSGIEKNLSKLDDLKEPVTNSLKYVYDAVMKRGFVMNNVEVIIEEKKSVAFLKIKGGYYGDFEIYISENRRGEVKFALENLFLAKDINLPDKRKVKGKEEPAMIIKIAKKSLQKQHYKKDYIEYVGKIFRTLLNLARTMNDYAEKAGKSLEGIV